MNYKKLSIQQSELDEWQLLWYRLPVVNFNIAVDIQVNMHQPLSGSQRAGTSYVSRMIPGRLRKLKT